MGLGSARADDARLDGAHTRRATYGCALWVFAYDSRVGVTLFGALSSKRDLEARIF